MVSFKTIAKLLKFKDQPFQGGETVRILKQRTPEIWLPNSLTSQLDRLLARECLRHSAEG